MEAAEETLTYRDDTGLHKKLLSEKGKGLVETKSDESNYVDLDMKPNGAKTVKVSFTGEGNQLSVSKSDSSRQGEHDEENNIISEDFAEEHSEDTGRGPVSGELPLQTLIKLPSTDQDSENQKQRQAERDPSECSEHVFSENDELQYTDMYLNSKTESDDGTSAVLSDHCGSDTVEDESHYITTHEIQLTELDHDVDYDLGRGTCWEFEDDNLVYSFVDYASFESDETQEGTLILEGKSQVQSNLGEAVVSTEQDESDLCDSDKCASSDESLCKTHSGDPTAGKIHLSIKTSSRAVKEPLGLFDSSTCGPTKHTGDRSHLSFVSSGATAGPLCDRAQYFIPAPGRQHLATKLRRKDINEYSSGASSSISELDDADKEVRNLTAKSFRSLACPYFDAINLSTSSESSISEYGLNKWSAYVDLNYGNVSGGKERSVIAHKTTSATLEMNKNMESKRNGKSVTSTRDPQAKMHTPNKGTPSVQASSTSENTELKGPAQPRQRGVTLNFRCNVETGLSEGRRRPKSSSARSKAGTVLARSGCEMQYHHTDGTGDTHKRAIFASSLLKNVISKKMQFEQERKMERGEIRDTYPALSPCLQLRDHDVIKGKSRGRGLQRQTSESGSAFTVNSADDQHLEESRSASSEPAEEQKSKNAQDDSPEKPQQEESPSISLSQTQTSAFNSRKDEMPEHGKEAELSTNISDPQAPKGAKENEQLDTSSMLTKLLFVPSCQLLAKERDFTKDLSSHTPATDIPAGPQKCEKEFKMCTNGNVAGKDSNEREGKTPEIKICLRSVKESKGCTLNIASLLTPKISFSSVNTHKTTDDAKCHILSASDRIPNFAVRDIRETKCKFQTPIYHVRDVRKLVKSSYRFVSLDNIESKCCTASTTAGDKFDSKAKKEIVKHLLPTPIVIKCHSVKTNNKQTSGASQTQSDAGRSSPKIPSETSQCDTAALLGTTSRAPVAAKQLNPDQSEIQPTFETKLTKQRCEKSPGELAERRNESVIPKQAALEKLKAAVKTMEQLYVFDRNEWKRKNQAPKPITDSHVLSLITSEEQGAEELEAAAGSVRLTDTQRVPQTSVNIPLSETYKPQIVKGSMNIIHVPYSSDSFETQSQQRKEFSNKSVLHFGNGSKAHISISSVSNCIPQSSVLQTSSTMKSSETPVAPLSLKTEPLKHGQVEPGNVKITPTNPTVTQACSDSENYLTIPGLGHMQGIKLLNREPASRQVNVSISPARRPEQTEQKRSPLIMEYPAIAVHRNPATVVTTGPQQQHVLCFSPSVTAVSPTSSGRETVPQTQRKMLLDPTTGHYYLVDTPIHPTTKRLFDPETGQFVDVPMSHSPVAPVTPVTPVTPVPLSLSPLALSPGACAPTYMIYPGFIPSPTLPAQAVLPQSPCHFEEAGVEKVKNIRLSGKETNPTAAESTYYSATGEAPQGPQQLPVSVGHVTTKGGAVSAERKPVISITTQQGPRIIAPPSFDGTTMSFVVEHR